MKLMKIYRTESKAYYRRFIRALIRAGAVRVGRALYRVPDECVPGGRYTSGRLIVSAGDMSEPGEERE